jgi:hypothetical protein
MTEARLRLDCYKTSNAARQAGFRLNTQYSPTIFIQGCYGISFRGAGRIFAT